MAYLIPTSIYAPPGNWNPWPVSSKALTREGLVAYVQDVQHRSENPTWTQNGHEYRELIGPLIHVEINERAREALGLDPDATDWSIEGIHIPVIAADPDSDGGRNDHVRTRIRTEENQFWGHRRIWQPQGAAT